MMEREENDVRILYNDIAIKYLIFKNPDRFEIEKEIHSKILDASKFIVRLYKNQDIFVADYDYILYDGKTSLTQEERNNLKKVSYETLIERKNNSLLGYFIVDLVVIDNILEIGKELINDKTRIKVMKGLNKKYLMILNGL